MDAVQRRLLYKTIRTILCVLETCSRAAVLQWSYWEGRCQPVDSYIGGPAVRLHTSAANTSDGIRSRAAYEPSLFFCQRRRCNSRWHLHRRCTVTSMMRWTTSRGKYEKPRGAVCYCWQLPQDRWTRRRGRIAIGQTKLTRGDALMRRGFVSEEARRFMHNGGHCGAVNDRTRTSFSHQTAVPVRRESVQGGLESCCMLYHAKIGLLAVVFPA